MLKVERLVKQYPPENPILKGLSFEVEPGQFVAVVGASGSGKTTLLKCIAMRESWTSGKLYVDGADIFAQHVQGKRKVRREYAYLEQSPMLSSDRTALKNVLIGRFHQTPLWRMVTGMIRSDDYMGAMDTIEALGLLDKAHKRTGELSGGEKQRIAIARALVHGARVLLMDEPVLGLDPASADSVMSTLRNLCMRERKTVIGVFHQLELAEKYATRIIGLAEGEIVLDVQGRRLLQSERARIL
ncbi:phosphonate ABC transporter ATP-binding protein [Paenibacillus sp. 481]|uniref:phosphonate ABC transporter ATP-binding protein n=1 Tax=Paenibacillus sp. 481 TaxID=2835869 RepID=UPI001E611F13|nr:ATP-binding cassette domain-containing protein [Paenibacillus sp. 481]UHA73606.1 ATP-binding cassette domain-containing protein [Paenibacillus sp. 481]